MSELSIIGLGWLGEPLARVLATEGMTVMGSVSSEVKAARLQAEGIMAHCWRAELGEPLPTAPARPIMIVMLPPSRCPDYLVVLTTILASMEQYGGQKLLFISSTSVYGMNDSGAESWSPIPMMRVVSYCWRQNVYSKRVVCR